MLLASGRSSCSSSLRSADLEQTVPCYRAPAAGPPRLRGRGRTPPLPGRAEKSRQRFRRAPAPGQRALRLLCARQRCLCPNAGRRDARRAAPQPAPRAGRAPPSGQRGEPPAGEQRRPAARGGRARSGSRIGAARRDAAYALPATLLSVTAFLRPCFSVSPLSSCLSPSPGCCLKNTVARQTHRQGLGLPLFRARHGARSDRNRSPMSLRPLLLQQKLNPGTGSCHPTVLRSSYRFPIPHSLRKMPTPGRLEVHGASRLLLSICSYLSLLPTRKQ